METKQEFQDMAEKLNSRIEQNGRETEQDMEQMCGKLKQDMQEIVKNFSKESEKVTETLSEIVAKTDSKLSRSKNRRIRKMRLMKSLGINISKFRKQQTKENRLGRVKETKLGQVKKLSDCELIKCKRNAPTKHKSVKIKGKRKLIKCNAVTNDKVIRTNSSKVETKVFQSRHDKVKRQQESVFSIKQSMCAEMLSRLGEQGSNIHGSNEKQINFQIMIRKSRHKISLERLNQESGTSQPLNHLVQNEKSDKRIRLSRK
jgi:hypothetical protein